MKYFIYLISLLLVIQTTKSDDPTKNINLSTKCKTGCNKMFIFDDSTKSLEIPKQKQTDMIMKKCKKKINVYYMFRRKYAVIVTKNFGSRPIFTENKNVPIYKSEAEEWINKGMCKIGKLCKPNGDCWGGSSDECREDKTNDWVDRRNFQYEGITWDASFRDTCTMDWSCQLKKVEQDITINKYGDPITYVDGKEQQLDSSAPTQFYNKEGYSIYIDEHINCVEKYIKPLCFVDGNTAYCEHKLDNGKSRYITLEEGSKCVYWGHQSYCLPIETNHLDEEDTQNSPSMNDIKEVTSAIRTIEKILNKNFFILKNENNEIKDKLRHLIVNSLDQNPTLLSPFFNKQIYSRKITNEIVEICPCADSVSCKERELHEEKVSFCPPENKDNIPKIKLYHADQNITILDDIDFDLVGKDINVILDHLEETSMQDHQFSSDQQGIFMDTLNSYFSPWHYIVEYSGLLALGISLYNVLILRRR